LAESVASAPKRPVDANFPERVGRYEILMPIGTGGMATVYLARAMVVEGIWREFALKLMHPHVRADPELGSQLLQEARLAARIRHANVVSVVEVADDPLGMFLVMDYVEGDALSGLASAARARGTLLPPRIVGRILTDALIGLHVAHELRDDNGKPLNLVHRDFSPHNILVGTDGLGRLADFGIAKAEGENATATGVLKGKVAYMAPEYVRGHEPDRRSDVWSAGVVLWELLVGTRPFRVKNDAAALVRLITQQPPRIEEALPDIPRPVAELVRFAMTVDVERRCPDALTLSKSLSAAWAVYGGLAEPSEVGDYVSSIVSTTLKKRREEASRISERRVQSASGSAPASSEQKTVVLSSEEQTGSPQVIPRPRRRRVAVGAGGALLVAAAGAALVWSLDDRAPAPDGVVAETPALAPEQRSVVVRSEQPMAKLRVARRNVPVTSPTREIEVDLLASETGDLVIEATSTDGRFATHTLRPNEGSLTIAFAEPAVSAVPAASSAPAVVKRHAVPKKAPPRPAQKPKPGLAPTPFGK
jgi:serine/threonine-protein kinase